jgi:two-component system, chemotaxis family, sensor kinase CheA
VAHDPYKYFRVEARELVDELGRGVLALEKGAPAADGVARLLRLAHTLKGAARVVKQREIADAAHSIEDALAPLRDPSSAAGWGGVDPILALIDGISGSVAALTPTADPQAPAPARLAPDEALRTVRADVAEMDALLDGVDEAHVQLALLRRSAQSLERGLQVAGLLADQLAAPRAARDRFADGAPANDGAASPKTAALAEELRDFVAALARGLGAGVEQIDRELRQVREAAERLRLLPAAALFGSLERTARDAAQALGKRVSFDGKGGDVRLDAHVLGEIQSALVQLIRNAVAHGIEPESARRATRKPPEGRVCVEIVRRGRLVSFVCADDGRGVDVDGILRAAQRKGLVSGDAEKLGPAQLLRLLLTGGISTSGAVTEVAGRGVGLDVVRAAVERLGGEVSVETTPGKGTVVELVVPTSLAALDVLIVEAAGVSAAIPLDTVRRALRIGTQAVAQTAEGETIVFEGKVIPFLPLERPLARQRLPGRAAKAWSTVVIQGGGGLAAVGVDRLLGTASLVVRPLPELAPADPMVAGAALAADGSPRLVLDADGIVAQALRPGPNSGAQPPAGRPILVIDDSLTTRMLEQSILEAAGYVVDLVASAEEALLKTGQREYGLFLVDVEMPGMDGFTFVERTRADPALRDIPAILVTSRSSPEDRRRGETAGASAYIVKSEFDQADLLGRIAQLMR